MNKDSLPRAPGGFKWVYNRLPRVFEQTFDAVPQVFQPHEYLLKPADVAEFLYAKSLISIDLTTSAGVRALVTEDDKHFGVPVDAPEGEELIDRTHGDNPLGRSTGGLKTKATKIPVAKKH